MFGFVASFRTKHPLLSFVSGRLLTMIFMLFVLGLGVFGLMALAPGDVVDNYVRSKMVTMTDFKSTDNIMTPEQIAAAKHRLGLDLPFYQQYFRWLDKVFIKHDLGRSLISEAPVLYLLQSRMFNSIILNLISLVFLTTISFALGVWLSSKAGTRLDPVLAFSTLFLHAFPGLLMLLLLQVFAAVSGWFPITAYPTENFDGNPVGFTFSWLHHVTLPLIASFLGSIGGELRSIRATMLDQLGQPYITALRSRGISEPRVYFNHAFRNTMNPFITGASGLLAGLFSGSLLLEIIFSYPGIGRLTYEAAKQKDIDLLMATLMFTSALILIGMVLADVILALVDPRIRYSKS